MKILLIEDDATSRRQMSRLIEKRGHTVTAFATAEEGAAELAHTFYPFLILDWMLPGKSGLELCRELRARPDGDEMFILLVTGRSDAEDLKLALRAGANDYLTKPLDAARLNVRLSVAEGQIRELEERILARAALRDAAQRMTDILEKTSDGFFALDALWNFTFLNAEAENTFGQDRHALIGKNLWEIFPALIGSVFEEGYRRAMTEHRAVEFEAASPNGKAFYEIHAYPSGGGVSVFFRDISARRKAEEERLTKSKLESLGTLAGGIAHDLNNILTVISGNIGLAQLEAPTHCGHLLSFLARAGQAAQSAAQLSRQLLTFSKGGAPLKKVVSIAELVQHAANFSLHGSNLRAAIEIEDHLGKAEIDAAQVEQVINAIIINAREAMPNGGTVSVLAENFRIETAGTLPLAPGRYIKISIADRGSGVPPELASKIFDPYFTTKPAATGLGLAISYSIVKKHGGYLHLEHNSPAGATFAFYLPTAPIRPVVAQLSPNEQKIFNPQRILVMDDEAPIRELTSQLLGTMGYEVTAVPDGSEAVRIYERAARKGEAFQAVILDATVRGGVGGVETIERLRNLDPEVNAIICSGYSDAAAISQFLSYGFRGALAKPFTRRELAEVLQKTLGRDELAPNPA